MTKSDSNNSVPLSPSTRKARNLLWSALAIGFGAGVYFGVADNGSASTLFSNEPISSTVAIVGIIIWLIAMPLVSWLWWRSVDEHEAGTYREGAMVSAHLYLFLVPAWWLGARAGWLPDQDPMVVFLIVCSVWSIVWLYRKYF